MTNLTNTIKTAAGAYLSFNAAQKIGTAMTQAGSTLEAYRGTLNVVMKDQKKAAEAMMWAVQFANKTPFETESVVEATVKLESYGLKAMEVLPQIGDMAGVMNKDIIQAVEAVADAQNGELERLKEFGITKKQIIEHGEKQMKMMNLVNNKGQINDQEQFNKVLFSLMDSRFKGGMEQQAGMYKGIMSTISGVWKTGLATMSGVSMTGEVVDGSLFHMLKVNAGSIAERLTQFVNDGTFERAGKRIAGFFKFIGSGIDLAKSGIKKAWPYIKKTGKIISSLVGKSKKSIARLKPLLKNIGSTVNWFKNIFMNGFSKSRIVIEKNIPKLLAFKDNIIDLAIKVKNGIGGAFEVVKPAVKWIFEDGLPLVALGLVGVIGFATDLYDNFNNNWTTIEPIITTIGDALKDGLVFAFEAAQPLVEWMITDGLPVFAELMGELIDGATEFYNFIVDNWSAIEPIVVGITAVFAGYKIVMLAMAVVTKVQTIWTTALAVATGALAGAIAILTAPITWVLVGIAALIAIGWAMWKNWDEILAWFQEKFALFGEFVQPVTSAIGGAFDDAITWVKDAWGGIGEWFSNLWDGVAESGRGFVNFFLKAVNWIVDGINKISFTIPDWIPEIGGKSFGFDIANVPYLAKGGVTTGPTLAMIGEGREQEAVLPLSKLRGLLNLAILRSRKMDEKESHNRNSVEGKIASFTNVTKNNNKKITIEYKPSYVFHGDVDKNELKKVIEDDQRSFKRNTKGMFDRDKRLSLG